MADESRRFSRRCGACGSSAGATASRCPVCGGVLRSGTILFGESLPVRAIEQALAVSQAADLMLVIGTSLVVNPAARLPAIAKRSGAAVAIVNREPTPFDEQADVVERGGAGPILRAFADTIHGV